jgi:hypothetical protein
MVSADEYLKTHHDSIEATLSSALSAAVKSRASSPLAFMAEYLARASKAGGDAASACELTDRVSAFFSRSDSQTVNTVFEECAVR